MGAWVEWFSLTAIVLLIVEFGVAVFAGWLPTPPAMLLIFLGFVLVFTLYMSVTGRT